VELSPWKNQWTAYFVGEVTMGAERQVTNVVKEFRVCSR